MSRLPWEERVPLFSINPDAANSEDVARMAAELMEARRELMVARKLIWKVHISVQKYSSEYGRGEG
jgi:hypothetical protein